MKKKQKKPPKQRTALLEKYRKKQLPENFAERVLDLEIHIEKSGANIDIEQLNELLFLYSSAIEYYESIESAKYIDLTTRMQNLLVKSSVLTSLENTANERRQHNISTRLSIRNCRTSMNVSHTLPETTNLFTLQNDQPFDLAEEFVDNPFERRCKRGVSVELAFHPTDNKSPAREHVAMLRKSHNIVEKEMNTQKHTFMERLAIRKQRIVDGRGSLSPRRSRPLLSAQSSLSHRQSARFA